VGSYRSTKKKGDEDMKYQRRISILLFVILSLSLFLPSISVLAQKNQDQILVYTVPAFVWGEVFVLDDSSVEMPNGFYKVDMTLKFYWLSAPFDPFNPDENILGPAIQHVVGVRRTNGVETLYGSGVYTSTIPGKPGTITYTNDPINPDDDKMWAGRLRIVGGTETFEGIKGPAELNFDLMAFELYLHDNPWE
jgi:hypothetical protein